MLVLCLCAYSNANPVSPPWNLFLHFLMHFILALISTLINAAAVSYMWAELRVSLPFMTWLRVFVQPRLKFMDANQKTREELPNKDALKGLCSVWILPNKPARTSCVKWRVNYSVSFINIKVVHQNSQPLWTGLILLLPALWFHQWAALHDSLLVIILL